MPGYTLTNKAMADLKEIARYTQGAAKSGVGRVQQDGHESLAFSGLHYYVSCQLSEK